MTRYVRVKSGGLIEVVKATPQFVSGYRVNREGGRVERVTKDTIQTFLDIFPPSHIVCEMRMNLHYGELEKVS